MSTINTTETLPHQVLTAIPTGEKPTFTTLLLIHQEINANAMAVTSNRGGGQYGHLATVIPTPAYNALPNTNPWIDPIHPGNNPVHPPGATAAQITEINRQYKANLEEYQLFHATKALLKTQLLAAVPDTYTKLLKHNQFGYANTTVLQLLTHLDTTYGTVTFDDLDANLQALNRQWDPSQPIEDLWNQIRECRTYAEPHDPITEPTAIRAAITNLTNSGVFTDALKDWRKRTPAQHTWANLVADFNLADKERRRNLTSTEAGFANQATRVPLVPKEIPGFYYCWSHGLSNNKSHTSATCSFPALNHDKTATLTDMKGGNCTIRRRKGERAIYRRPPRPGDGKGNSKDENTPPTADKE